MSQKIVTILFLGDSITFGYALLVEESYPSLVVKKLLAHGVSVNGINAGVSGDTSAQALHRLSQGIANKEYSAVDLIFVAIGINDVFNGISLEQTNANLSQIIALARKEKMKILLAGIHVPSKIPLPPTAASAYNEKLTDLYTNCQQKFNLAFMPFLLAGVANKKEFNLDDLHPNAQGYEIIAKNITPLIIPLVNSLQESSS